MLYENLSINDKGNLCFAGHDTTELAEKYGTPAYVMDENKIRERCRVYKKAMSECFGGESKPLFASKALCFKRIYQIMAEEKMGIDVVSPGELYTAFVAGFPMENAYFHGNNKTDDDIEFAIDKGIGYFMCDNADELKVISETAKKKGITQKIILRLTPGIDPHTHAKISTGKVDSKFGAAIETGQAEELLSLALSLDNIDVKGYHCHIGSQIFEYKPFCDAAIIMIKFIAEMRDKLGYTAQVLNLGGGMGVRYLESDPQIDYAANIKGISQLIQAECDKYALVMPEILMEPGRSIVADSGITLYTIGGRKEIKGFKNYVSVDGGMPDNPRYTLYQSAYTIVTANRMNEAADYECTIAGRCCESGDLLAEDIKIAKPVRGDILAVMTTGAYNYAMSSNYNAITKPPVIMLNGEDDYIAVRRESYEDMIKCHE